MNFWQEVDAQNRFLDNMINRSAAVRVPLILYPDGMPVDRDTELFVVFDEFIEGEVLKDVLEAERPENYNYLIVDEFLVILYHDQKRF